MVSALYTLAEGGTTCKIYVNLCLGAHDFQWVLELYSTHRINACDCYLFLEVFLFG